MLAPFTFEQPWCWWLPGCNHSWLLMQFFTHPLLGGSPDTVVAHL